MALPQQTQAERDAEGAKCRQLEEQIKKQQEVTRDLQGSHLEAERLQTRCAELDGRTKGLQDEINEHLSVNQEQRKEISHLGETVRCGVVQILSTIAAEDVPYNGRANASILRIKI